MSETSVSLLDRLRSHPEDSDWQRLVTVYTPFIETWLRKNNLPAHDAQDLVQEVLAVVARRINAFEHNQRVGAFRNWLRTITVNCLRDFWKRQRLRPQAAGGSDFQGFLAEMEDSDSDLTKSWNRDHDVHVMRSILQHIEREFGENTWRAFQRVALDEMPAATAAAELGISVNAVFIAKSRVLARLRQEADGMLDLE